ncbi:MAG TPA: hypothetical protein PKZ41_04105, partial [Candidatus Omnitrophota bacterium]|nr:hypothetical protein [Candidatus Omnitrophota bacterium]
MKQKNHDHGMEIFRKFNENWDLRREVTVFGEILKFPAWVILPFLTRTEELKGTELARIVLAETK